MCLEFSDLTGTIFSIFLLFVGFLEFSDFLKQSFGKFTRVLEYIYKKIMTTRESEKIACSTDGDKVSPEYKIGKEKNTELFKDSVVEIRKGGDGVVISLDELADDIEKMISSGKNENKWSKSVKSNIIKFMQRVKKELFPLRYEKPSSTNLETSISALLLQSYDRLVSMVECQHNTIADLKEANDGSQKLINGLNELIREVMKEKEKEQPLTVARTTSSYAAVVTAKMNEVTVQQVLKKVREATSPAEMGLKISSVREGINGKVIVKCGDEKSLRKFTECMKDCEDMDMRKPEPLKAIVKVLGVQEDECMEDVVKKILNQNDLWTENITEENYYQHIKLVKSVKMGSNLRLRKLFLMVSAEIRTKLNDIGGVYVGYKWAKVVDDIPLLQCFKCLGFGHVASKCRNEERCMFCSKNHRSNICELREVYSRHRCYNCLKYMDPRDSNHKANSWLCPFYKRTQLNVVKRMVSGGLRSRRFL